MAEPALEENQVEPYQDEEIEETADDAWCVNSIELADWSLKRIAALKALIAQNERVAEANITREKLMLEKLNAEALAGVAFFTNHLKLYATLARAELLAAGKKTRRLSHGSIGWKKKPAVLEVKDEVALLAWAEEQLSEVSLVRVKREPALVAIKERFKKTGEVPDGMDVVPEDEEFVVKTTEVSDGSGI